MNDKLLPCPFCGSEAYFSQPVLGSEWFEVSCNGDECGVMGPSFKSKDQAAAVWNRRVAPPPHPHLQAAPSWLKNCCQCGRVVDTREINDGGDPFGCIIGGRWTCSIKCYDVEAGHDDSPASQPPQPHVVGDDLLATVKEFARWHHLNELTIFNGGKPSDSEIDIEATAWNKIKRALSAAAPEADR